MPPPQPSKATPHHGSTPTDQPVKEEIDSVKPEVSNPLESEESQDSTVKPEPVVDEKNGFTMEDRLTLAFLTVRLSPIFLFNR